MSYVLNYQQTPHERYNTDMNDRARALIESHGAEIVGEGGGSGGPPDEKVAMVADAEFVIKTTHANALTIQRALSENLGRQVTHTFEAD